MESTLLKRFAAKYIWWKTLDEALLFPDRIITQVMDLGDYEDAQRLIKEVGEEELRRVVKSAEAGQFSPKSWTYWHYRLGMCDSGRVPELPQRRVA